MYIANITSDKDTGIGSWTDDEVLAAIQTLYGMPWPYYGGMTDDDLHALVKALRDVPAIKNLVKDAELKL